MCHNDISKQSVQTLCGNWHTLTHLTQLLTLTHAYSNLVCKTVPVLAQEIEATEAARLKARKKRKRQGGADNPFFPKGPLPVMADQIATALRRFGTAFKPHLYVDVRPSSPYS